MGFPQLLDNRIPIHQIHSLCDCDEQKRVQRYAYPAEKAEAIKGGERKLPTQNIGQLPISP